MPMSNESPEIRYPLLRNIFILIGVFWTIIILSFLTWNIKSEKKQTTQITLSQARSFFKQIVTSRFWNSLHGGVYVPVTETTQPNPYLDVANREVITQDGVLLTLINPAYMTRQISEISATQEQIQSHITSLKPIRPDNIADPWEANALNSFTDRSDEYHDWWTNDKGATFRYMAPLWTDRPCLRCHSKQGYVEGDLRGGISVIIPAGDVLSVQNKTIRAVVFGYALIWLMGMIGTVLSFFIMRREQEKRLNIIRQLQSSINEVKTLKGLIPICASCKSVRNDEGYWDQIEKYVSDHSDADFSHSICPVCMEKLYPEFADEVNNKKDFSEE